MARDEIGGTLFALGIVAFIIGLGVVEILHGAWPLAIFPFSIAVLFICALIFGRE